MTNLGVLSKGINEVIQSYGMECFLDKGSDTNWVPLLKSIAKKVFPWVKNYFGGNAASEMQYELLIDMFSNVYLEKADKVFRSYDPDNSPLNIFLYFVMEKDAINISNNRYGKYKDQFGNTEHLNPQEGESDFEALDRILGGVEVPLTDRMIFEDMFSKLSDIMSDRKSYLIDMKVLLFLMEGYLSCEIAERLSVSPQQIAKRVSRIRENVRKLAIYFDTHGDDFMLTLLKEYRIN